MATILNFFLEHWILTTTFFVLLVAFLGNEWWYQRSRMMGLSPQAVVQLMNHQHAMVYDLRSEALFHLGHILGAHHTSVEKLSRLEAKNKQKPIILLGTQSDIQKAREILQGAGYLQIYHLEGGIESWHGSGLPLVKESS